MIPAVAAPERHPVGLDRDERRDARDSKRCRNAGRIVFRHFWDQIEMFDVLIVLVR